MFFKQATTHLEQMHPGTNFPTKQTAEQLKALPFDMGDLSKFITKVGEADLDFSTAMGNNGS